MALGLLSIVLLSFALSVQATDFPEWCVVPPTVHVLQNQTCASLGPLASNAVQWYAMAGEQESKQVLLDTRSWPASLNMSGNLSVTFGDLHGQFDIVPATSLQWLQVGYVFCRHTTRYADSGGGWRPDPLLPPTADNTIPLEVSVTTPIWLNIRVPDSAIGSQYDGNITITLSLPGGERLQQEIAVHLTVWKISLPDYNTSKFNEVFSFNPQNLDVVYGNASTSVANLFYSLFIEQRIGGDNLYASVPTDLKLAETLAKTGNHWLSLYDVYGAAGIAEEFRVRGACINFTHDLVEKVLDILTPVVEQYSAAGILDRMFVYGFDEAPEDCEESIRSVFGAIKSKWPQIRTMAVLNWLPATDLPLDVWVLQYEFYDASEAQQWIAAGKQQWWYHCIEPSGTQYLNTFIERPLLMARLLFWLAGAHEVGGWLYYSTLMWHRYPTTSSPITRESGTARTNFDPANYIWLPRTDIFANGDGNFVYPGPAGPVASVRLMNLRDGLEDIELLRMLSLSEANQLVEPLVRSPTNYTLDPLLLEKQRVLAASKVPTA